MERDKMKRVIAFLILSILSLSVSAYATDTTITIVSDKWDAYCQDATEKIADDAGVFGDVVGVYDDEMLLAFPIPTTVYSGDNSIDSAFIRLYISYNGLGTHSLPIKGIAVRSCPSIEDDGGFCEWTLNDLSVTITDCDVLANNWYRTPDIAKLINEWLEDYTQEDEDTFGLRITLSSADGYATAEDYQKANDHPAELLIYYGPPTPAPVYGVDTVSVGTTSVALIWAKNASDFCTGYEIRAKAGQYFYPTAHTQGWLVAETDTITDTTVTATELLPGTWQSLTVFAKGDETYSDTAAGDSSSISFQTDGFGGFNYFRHLNVVNNGANTLYDYPVKARLESGFVDAEYLAQFNSMAAPMAIYDSDTNRTYITYISKAESAGVFYYDHNVDTITPPYYVGIIPTAAEVHGTPSIILDTLGYVHIFYGCHTTPLKHSCSSVPYEIDEGWDVISTPAELVTYPHPILLKDGNIGMGLRGEGASQNKIFDWWHSTDNGSTWAQTAILLPDSGSGDLGRIYLGSWAMDDSGNIHWGFMFLNEESTPDNFSNLYYLKCLANGSTWVNTAGDTYSLPINLTQAEMAMRTDTNVVYRIDYTADVDTWHNRPYMVASIAKDNDSSLGACWFITKHDTGWANYEICHIDEKSDNAELFVEDSLNMEIFIPRFVEHYYQKSEGEYGNAGGGNIEVWRTTNGGETWQKILQLTDYPVQIIQLHKVYNYDINVPSYIKVIWSVGLIQPNTMEIWPPRWDYGYYDFNYDMIGSDGRDVRFYSNDLSDTFHYFLERWESWGWSDFWFKPDSIPVGTTKVLVAMGNSALSSESCGDSVFDFFEDFTVIDDWTEIHGTANTETVTFIDGRQVPAFSVQGTLNLIRKALPYDSMTISDWMFVNYSGDMDNWATYLNQNGRDSIGWHYAGTPPPAKWQIAAWSVIDTYFSSQALFGLTPPYTNTCGWIPWEYNSKTGMLKFQYDSVYTIAAGIETDSISIGDYSAADSNAEAYATYIMGRMAVSTEPTTYWGEATPMGAFWHKITSDFAPGDLENVIIADDEVKLDSSTLGGTYSSDVILVNLDEDVGCALERLEAVKLDIPGVIRYWIRASDESFAKDAATPAWQEVISGEAISPPLEGSYIQYKIQCDNLNTSDKTADWQMRLGKVFHKGEETSKLNASTDKPGVDEVGVVYRKHRK